MKGVLISVEGLDSSGKTTQIELLKEQLEKIGKKAAVFKFPSYEKTYYGRLIRRYLQGEFGRVEAVSPYLIGVIYALDRLEIRDEILAELDAGKVVLLDRYVASNKAYMGAKLQEKDRRKFIDWMDELDFSKNRMPREDAIIFLDVPVAITLKLMENKKKDIHENNAAYIEEVWKVYKSLSKGEKWTTIGCVESGKMLAREAIAGKIHDAVEHLVS